MENQLGRYDYEIGHQAYSEEVSITEIGGEGGRIRYIHENKESGIEGGFALKPGFEAIIGVYPDGSTYHYLQKTPDKQEEEDNKILEHSSGFKLNTESGIIDFSDGREVDVTPSQSKVLALLMNNQNRIVSYQEIARYLWPNEYEEKNWENIKVYINRIRNIIDEKNTNPDESIITARRGFGYGIFDNPSSEEW